MGSNPRAHLAYGYDLGSYEDFKAAERGEWGSPNLPWLDEDASTYAFSGAAEDILRAAGLAAVEIAFSGAEESIGWMLIAKDSKRTVDWTDALVLDLAKMEHPPGEWFDRLTSAVEALGITPTQDWPRWLVFPSYG